LTAGSGVSTIDVKVDVVVLVGGVGGVGGAMLWKGREAKSDGLVLVNKRREELVC
jgi:hypothetical protein